MRSVKLQECLYMRHVRVAVPVAVTLLCLVL